MTKIRQAVAADIPRVIDLNDALFQEDAGQHDSTMNLNWSREHGAVYFQKYLDSPTGIMYLAEVDSQVVGYLAGYIKPPTDYRHVTSAELESIYVEKAFRARGVGQALTRAFLDWCVAKAAVRVTVTAYSANRNAIAFYQQLGFEPKHTSLELKLGESGHPAH